MHNFTEIKNINGCVFGLSLIARLGYNEIYREKWKISRFPYHVETVLVSTSSPPILLYICALLVKSIGRMPHQYKDWMQVDIGIIFYTTAKPSATTCSH